MAEQALPPTGRTGGAEWIQVSPEMTAIIGRGDPTGAPLPPDPLLLCFELSGAGGQAAVRIGAEGMSGAGPESDDADRLLLIVARAAWRRLGGPDPESLADTAFHLPSDLRAIVLALGECALEGEPRNVYRLAKSIELLCDTLRAFGESALMPLVPGGGLSSGDWRRIVEARRMIDERWHEKLTLETIARACGLNRDKLTRGFRIMYDCSIAEALAARRLRQAGLMLRTTDKPVSSIGYANGYLNNASFARAFSRHYGVSPSDYRAARMAS